MTRRPVNILLVRALTWPLLATFNVVARVWTLLGSTSRRRARRLAESDPVRQARQAAEARLRAIAHAYAGGTPLVLHLLVVEDHCTRGMASWDLFTPIKPAYQVSCWMRLRAYYSSPLPPGETVSGILDAGEQPLSGIPFTHDHAREAAGARLAHAGHVLTWDEPGAPILEPAQSPNTYKLVRQPPTVSVADIRRRFGMVFALTLPPDDYYRRSW